MSKNDTPLTDEARMVAGSATPLSFRVPLQSGMAGDQRVVLAMAATMHGDPVIEAIVDRNSAGSIPLRVEPDEPGMSWAPTVRGLKAATGEVMRVLGTGLDWVKPWNGARPVECAAALLASLGPRRALQVWAVPTRGEIHEAVALGPKGQGEVVIVRDTKWSDQDCRTEIEREYDMASWRVAMAQLGSHRQRYGRSQDVRLITPQRGLDSASKGDIAVALGLTTPGDAAPYPTTLAGGDTPALAF
ncbi:MAG: hypothetical protein RJQ08_11645 [Salinisphaeraceae bacterium]